MRVQEYKDARGVRVSMRVVGVQGRCKGCEGCKGRCEGRKLGFLSPHHASHKKLKQLKLCNVVLSCPHHLQVEFLG